MIERQPLERLCRSSKALNVATAAAGAYGIFGHEAIPQRATFAVSTEPKPALVFIDTEFTDLANARLLSLGMASYDGREFYAELDPCDPANQDILAGASEFVRWGGVLDQWGCIPGAVVCARDVGKRAGDWLQEMVEEARGPLTVAFDYRTDYELLMQALEAVGLFERLRNVLQPINVADITDTLEAQQAADAVFDQLRGRGLARHHALADALALRAAYLAEITLRGGAL